jgi:radical SAM family uncharacterized protein/radical SAM-linked protein
MHMTIRTIDDILPLVEKPSRYLGSEFNSIKKDLSRVKIRLALGFPDLYEIGTSHFGMQILYHILNADPDIAAERVFAPGEDMESRLRDAGLQLFSLESRLPLNHFDIVGFSLLYELNYTNVLTMLDLGEIPFLASQRDLSHPLVIAGGPCTSNPEPIADFFDAIVVGDGESVVMQMVSAWLRWEKADGSEKEALLKMWSQIEGVYIPSFFEPQFDGRGLQSLKPRFPNYKKIKRAVVADLNGIPFPENPIIAYGKPVHDRLRLEIARGCTRGCRFCQAGMIYRPVRERSPEQLLSMSASSIAATGYEDISLLSLSTGDYGCIVPLIERLMARFDSEHVAVSLPSLRAGTLTPELMKLIRKVRKTGFTIAPEAGSQRLRDVINKNICQKEIIDTVKDAFNLGWQVIKLYFMIGLPTETDDDLKEMVDLVKKLRKIISTNGRRGKINVSVATFIPKSHTPFQWASQITPGESRSKINWLRDHLKLSGIQFKWQDPEVSRLEGIWARGDRRLNRLLIGAYRKGCKFDGWSDKFHYGLWKDAFDEERIDPDFFMARGRDIYEPLPWDHIDSRVDKSFLRQEWENALKQKLTDDCRHGKCHQCGTCDFEEIEVRTYPAFRKESVEAFQAGDGTGAVFKKLCVYYSKLGQAKYFGHLELVNIFLRALMRSKIPLQYSQGFHPKPKISFYDPLPVGIESQYESFVMTVPESVRPEKVARSLNAQLPDGLAVLSCQPAPSTFSNDAADMIDYMITLKEGNFDKDKLSSFIRNPDFNITISNRKGKLKKINLKDMVANIDLLDSLNLRLTLSSGMAKTVRPVQILRHIFYVAEEQIKQAKIVKLKAQGREHRA